MKSKTIDTQSPISQNDIREAKEVFLSHITDHTTEWEDAPQVIHLTFKSLARYLEKLDQRTQQIENSLIHVSRGLQDKVSKQYLEVKLLETFSKEADKSKSIDFKFRKEELLDAETMQEIRSIAYAAVQSKLQNFHYSHSESPSKQQYNNILQLTQLFNQELSKLKDSIKVCETKLFDKSVSSSEKKQSQEMTNMKSKLFQLQKHVQRMIQERIETPADHSVQRMYDPRTEHTISEVGTLRKMMEQVLKNKMDRKEFIDFKSKTNKELLQKIKLQQVEQIIKSFQSDLHNRIQDLKNQSKKMQKTITKQYRQDLEEIRSILSKNQSKTITPTTSNGSLKQIKLSLGRMEKKIADKMFEKNEDIPQIKQQFSDQLRKLWKKIQTQLQLRDQKLCQTIQQSKDTLRTQYRSTRNKSKEVPVDRGVEKIVNSICNQMVLGKWLSTQVNNSHCCVWEQQLANTMTENFVWQNNCAFILVVAPGVYRLQFGFFSTDGSLPSVVVNGDIALKGLQSKNKEVKKHPNGFINGYTMMQLILLPPRAKLAIQMSKNQNYESYLGLYKL